MNLLLLLLLLFSLSFVVVTQVNIKLYLWRERMRTLRRSDVCIFCLSDFVFDLKNAHFNFEHFFQSIFVFENECDFLVALNKREKTKAYLSFFLYRCCSNWDDKNYEERTTRTKY